MTPKDLIKRLREIDKVTVKKNGTADVEFAVGPAVSFRLLEDHIKEHAVWPPRRHMRDAPQRSNPRDVEYILAWIPNQAGMTNPASAFSVCWWEPNIDGGCWCSDSGENVKPAMWWPLPPIAAILKEINDAVGR
jgi:hypothetical protein